MYALRNRSTDELVGNTRRGENGETVVVPRLYTTEKNAKKAIDYRNLKGHEIISVGVRRNRRAVAYTAAPTRVVRNSVGGFVSIQHG